MTSKTEWIIVLYEKDGSHWKAVREIEPDIMLANGWVHADGENRSWSAKQKLIHAT